MGPENSRLSDRDSQGSWGQFFSPIGDLQRSLPLKHWQTAPGCSNCCSMSLIFMIFTWQVWSDTTAQFGCPASNDPSAAWRWLYGVSTSTVDNRHCLDADLPSLTPLLIPLSCENVTWQLERDKGWKRCIQWLVGGCRLGSMNRPGYHWLSSITACMTAHEQSTAEVL